MKKLLNERDVLNAFKRHASEILVDKDTLISPAASDMALARGITIKYVSTNAPATTPTSCNCTHVAIGSDHGGYELKQAIKEYLVNHGVCVEDMGTNSTASVDYPDFAHLVAAKVASTPDLLGIIIDGAGVGSAMAANKVRGIRAATCSDVYTARNSRLHNNANVLTLGSRVIGEDVAKQIVDVWLHTEFEGGRHKTRVDKIMDIEKRY